MNRIKKLAVAGLAAVTIGIAALGCAGGDWQKEARPTATRIVSDNDRFATLVAQTAPTLMPTLTWQQIEEARLATRIAKRTPAADAAATRRPTSPPRPMASFRFSNGITYNCDDLVFDYEGQVASFGGYFSPTEAAHTASQVIANHVMLTAQQSGVYQSVRTSEAQRAYQACKQGR